MPIVSPSVLRSKYALLGALGLLAAGLGTFGYQQWRSGSPGLFGDSPAANGQAVAGRGAQVGGLTGIDVVDDALDMLAGRSPGERTVAVSGKGKGPARAYRYTRSPAAQALEEAFSSPGASRVIDGRQAPVAPVAPALVLPPEVFGTAAAPGIIDAVLPAAGGGPGPSLGGLPFAPGGFSVGGGSGGGGGGGGVPGDGGVVPPVTPPVTPVVPAIPEPATWLLLLLGMAGTAAAMRAGKPGMSAPAGQPLAS